MEAWKVGWLARQGYVLICCHPRASFLPLPGNSPSRHEVPLSRDPPAPGVVLAEPSVHSSSTRQVVGRWDYRKRQSTLKRVAVCLVDHRRCDTSTEAVTVRRSFVQSTTTCLASTRGTALPALSTKNISQFFLRFLSHLRLRQFHNPYWQGRLVVRDPQQPAGMSQALRVKR